MASVSLNTLSAEDIAKLMDEMRKPRLVDSVIAEMVRAEQDRLEFEHDMSKRGPIYANNVEPDVKTAADFKPKFYPWPPPDQPACGPIIDADFVDISAQRALPKPESEAP